MYIDQQ